MSSPDPRALACALLLAALSIGCRQQMEDGARLKPLEAFPSASDEPSARHPVPGTVARGRLRIDEHLYAGTVDGKLAGTGSDMTVTTGQGSSQVVYKPTTEGSLQWQGGGNTYGTQAQQAAAAAKEPATQWVQIPKKP